MTRSERYAQIVEARERGEGWRETCQRLGISHSYYYMVLNDPTGEKGRLRRLRYGGWCQVCGAPTSGSSGSSKAPKLCVQHNNERNVKWPRERIVAAIQDYAERYGYPPGARDWNPAMARRGLRDDIAERYYADGCWPNMSTVMARFGSWNAAIAAAGFMPLQTGHKYSDYAQRVAR